MRGYTPNYRSIYLSGRRRRRRRVRPRRAPTRSSCGATRWRGRTTSCAPSWTRRRRRRRGFVRRVTRSKRGWRRSSGGEQRQRHSAHRGCGRSSSVTPTGLASPPPLSRRPGRGGACHPRPSAPSRVCTAALWARERPHAWAAWAPQWCSVPRSGVVCRPGAPRCHESRLLHCA